jgi:hypothetical protein
MHEVHGMRRPVLFFLAVLMTAAMLARSAAPVAACPCGGAPQPVEGTARWYLDRFEFVAVATVEEVTYVPPLAAETDEFNADQRARSVLSIEHYLAGAGPESITVEEHPFTSCSTPGLQTERRRLLLFLEADGGSLRIPGPCTNSGPVDGWFGPGFVEEITELSEQQERSNANESGFPALPAAAAAMAIPIAFLLAAAFLWRRQREA